MFTDVPAETDSEPGPLLEGYETLVLEAAAEAGVDAIVDATSLDRSSAEMLVDGEVPEIAVEDAAAVIALVDDRDANALVFELRDDLLMGMTTAVLDVDTIAGAIDADLTGQEVQQALEGRTRMTLTQLAQIQSVIEGRKP
ncbi:hypothetical protein GCM10027435_08910 [Haloparvum alkalitolerans]|uniref:DUF5791 family protein n=1 Tax=Haloparvum alkalitolerans TaxID=1042953 RepID=UPI003CEB0132